MGKRKPSRPQIDPELAKQLRAASANASPVEAVVVLRTVRATTKTGSDTDARAKAVLDRVSATTGLVPHDVNVFTNLSSFVVSAEARFIEGLFDQAEVTSVVANSRPDDDMLLSAKPPV